MPNFKPDIISYRQDNPRIIRVYLYYRFILGLMLLSFYALNLNDQFGELADKQLFYSIALIYTLSAFVLIVLLRSKTLLGSQALILTLLCFDLFALMTVLHTSGSVQNSLSFLLLIITAMAGMFLSMQAAYGFAALTVILLLSQAMYFGLEYNLTGQLFSAGLLGCLIFATTLIFRYLTERERSSHQEANIQSIYAAQLQEFAQHIVTRMRTGVVVINNRQHIELINESALQLLDLPHDLGYINQPISAFQDLNHIVNASSEKEDSSKPQVYTCQNGQELRISLATLDASSQNKLFTDKISSNKQNEKSSAARLVYYLEDNRVLQQQAQQLKLASLGKLTASIAHEIRNPLGAISHASQLLSESDQIVAADQRLLEIVLQHCKRMNQIIDNTLAISRRQQGNPEVIDLVQWLPSFIAEYQNGQACHITSNIDVEQALVRVDPNQIRQVFNNLFDNGIRYSMERIKEAKLLINIGINANINTPYVEVIDFGNGVPEEDVKRIFEPFFTTDKQGSGLGLYICRELCEINQATLFYLLKNDTQSCFRLNFSYHKKMA